MEAGAGSIAHVVAVASGKGGVGKSTISLNLAIALSEEGRRVGLLDADVYGPDIPLMLNITRSVPLKHWMLARDRKFGSVPLDVVERAGPDDGLDPFAHVPAETRRMIGAHAHVFVHVEHDQPRPVELVEGQRAEHQSLSWPASMVEVVVRQLVGDVQWGQLDVLVVDLPPGTADVQQTVLRLLPRASVVLVVTPQDVAHMDARKLLDMCRSSGRTVIGAVENMSALRCPHCGESVQIFPEVPESRSIWAAGVDCLARISLDPAVAASAEAGVPVVLRHPETDAALAFRQLAESVRRSFE